MHPDMLRELADQRTSERRSRAEEARQASSLRRALRARRHHDDAAGAFVVPPIPDYVDGTFREDGHAAAEHSNAGTS
jgi:hypothetical protein